MVKCSECGFLTFRHRASRELAEAEFRTRVDAWLPAAGGYYVYETLPLCFRGQRDFVHDVELSMLASGKRKEDAEVEALDPGQPQRQVIFEPIECSWFFLHVPGHTPKEHLDMLFFQEERAHQQQMHDEQRVFQEKMTRGDQQWRREEGVRQRDFQMRLVVIAGILGTLAAVVGAGLSWWLTVGSEAVFGS